MHIFCAMTHICGQACKIIQSYFTDAKADILFDHPSTIEAIQVEKCNSLLRHDGASESALFYLILDSLVCQNKISVKSSDVLLQYPNITVSTSKHLIHTILQILCKLKQLILGVSIIAIRTVSRYHQYAVFSGSVKRENIAHVYSVRCASKIMIISVLFIECKWPYIIRQHICIMMIWMYLYLTITIK